MSKETQPEVRATNDQLVAAEAVLAAMTMKALVKLWNSLTGAELVKFQNRESAHARLLDRLESHPEELSHVIDVQAPAETEQAPAEPPSADANADGEAHTQGSKPTTRAEIAADLKKLIPKAPVGTAKEPRPPKANKFDALREALESPKAFEELLALLGCSKATLKTMLTDVKNPKYSRGPAIAVKKEGDCYVKA